MTPNNHLECWLCDNVLLLIPSALRTRRQCMTVFSEKNIEQNKCEKFDFLQIRHFFIVDMGKTSSKSWTKQGTYCTTKTLSFNRWIAMWLRQYRNDRSNKNPFFQPLFNAENRAILFVEILECALYLPVLNITKPDHYQTTLKLN